MNRESLSQSSDEMLVCMVLQGESQAFDELVQRHRGACVRMAVATLRNRADAEDQVQNALWKAFRHLDQCENRARFSSWLVRIVINECLMRIRRDRPDRRQPLDLVESQVFDANPCPETCFLSDETKAIVRREIQRLPAIFREPVKLHELDQLPMPRVAEQLGISVSAAKSRLLRGRLAIRDRFHATIPVPKASDRLNRRSVAAAG